MSEGVEFPWQHSFPPFYTLQPNTKDILKANLTILETLAARNNQRHTSIEVGKRAGEFTKLIRDYDFL